MAVNNPEIWIVSGTDRDRSLTVAALFEGFA
jgi:hypothetical protein